MHWKIHERCIGDRKGLPWARLFLQSRAGIIYESISLMGIKES